MKKFIITLILFITIISSTFATVTDNEYVIQNTTVEQVENIFVNMPSRIYFIDSTDDTIQVRIDTSEKYIKDKIHYNVVDSTIMIILDSRYLDNNFNINPNDIKIYITSPNDMKVKTSRSLVVTDNRKTSNRQHYENN